MSTDYATSGRAGGLALGIDLGTQSTKVLVYDPARRQIEALAQAPLELHVGPDGAREQQAAWWLAALHQCLAQIPAALKAQVAMIGVSGQQHGLVPLAAGGTVLAPVKLWNDTSTAQECALLHARLGGEERAVALAGNPVMPGYTASKVLWLQRHRPELYARLHTILLPHDYLNFYLTGRRTMEAGDASGTGFFAIRERRWCREILTALDPERDLSLCLPPLLLPHEAAGVLQPEVASELGLPAGILVAAGGGDNMMGAIGTGAVAAGKLTISLGTSGTLYAYTPTPLIAPAGEFAAFCASTGGYLPLLCTMNCTSATQTVRELLQLPLAAAEALLEASAPGAGGITALPFFGGERTPNVPRGEACFFGLTTSNATRPNLLRAVVEATVFGLRTGLTTMRALGLEAATASLIGGGAASAAWRRIVAEALQLEVVRPSQPESAAFGAALQALWCWSQAQGQGTSIGELASRHVAAEGPSLKPDAATVSKYDKVYQRYQGYLRVVEGLYR